MTNEEASAGANNNDNDKNDLVEFPAAKEHSFSLEDGRKLSYYTFDCACAATTTSSSPNSTADVNDDDDDADATNKKTKQQQQQQLHPVLYFHGFPGCGLEGRVCARQVYDAGGELYAPSRPGMGYSDPYPPIDDNTGNGGGGGGSKTTTNDDDESKFQLDTFVRDTWEFVESNGWKEFSIIGVSGGGPYALAVLSSFVEKQNQKQQQEQETANDEDAANTSATTSLPILRNVSFVAGVCISAGTDSMMSENQYLTQLAASARAGSWWSWFQLRCMLALPSAAARMLPESWMMQMLSSTSKQLPQVDKDCFLENPAVANVFIEVLQQSSCRFGHGVVQDCAIIFRPGHDFESTLKQFFAAPATGDNDRDSGKTTTPPPRVGVFQGNADVNVPQSHALYVHRELLNEKSELQLYEDFGHVSLVVTKSQDYATFAVRGGVVGGSNENNN